jgi:hypothetical protein
VSPGTKSPGTKSAGTAPPLTGRPRTGRVVNPSGRAVRRRLVASAPSPALAIATANSTAGSRSARRHTRQTMTISFFSANGAIRHQVRGSRTYRAWERISSGSRLPSRTGLVVSQASTPGGST